MGGNPVSPLGLPLAPPDEAAGMAGRARTCGPRPVHGACVARERLARIGTVQVRGELAVDSDSFSLCSREVASLLVFDCILICKT